MVTESSWNEFASLDLLRNRGVSPVAKIPRGGSVAAVARCPRANNSSFHVIR